MTTKFLLGRGVQLACGSANSRLFVVRAVLNLRIFACAMGWCASVIVVHRSAAERFSSICWSAGGSWKSFQKRALCQSPAHLPRSAAIRVSLFRLEAKPLIRKPTFEERAGC